MRLLRTRYPADRHRGTAMVEFAVVALPLLLIGLGTFEAGRWLLMRQAVGYALFEAARAGAVTQADPATMARAFQLALAPALGVGGPTTPDELAAAVQARLARWERTHGLPMARIEQLSPITASYDDFAEARESSARPRELDFDYQRIHHESIYRARYPGGTGPRSGQTIFQANTLVLRLTYLHAPYLEWVRALIRRLGTTSGDEYIERARAAGMVVITRHIAMPMQSAAREHTRTGNILGK